MSHLGRGYIAMTFSSRLVLYRLGEQTLSALIEVLSITLNHLCRVSTFIWYSNTRISKVTCTLKCVVVPKWLLLIHDLFDVVSISRRIWMKWSIISMKYRRRDFSRNILISYPTLPSPFSMTMENILGHRGCSPSR